MVQIVLKEVCALKLRIKFEKKGAVKFLGHLDAMRFFQKTIRRAEIDICYSTGYSPHQIMSFAAPLGVGLESNGEYVDIEVNSLLPSEEFLARFNAASVAGIQALEVRQLEDNAKNAMSSVAAASYTLRFREGRELTGDLSESFTRFLAQETIMVTKETKKSTKTFDMKPFIFDAKVNEDQSIYLMVDASSGDNIKPGLVIETFASFIQTTLQENALMITREETYGLKDKDDKKSFLPLIEFGQQIWEK